MFLLLKESNASICLVCRYFTRQIVDKLFLLWTLVKQWYGLYISWEISESPSEIASQFRHAQFNFCLYQFTWRHWGYTISRNVYFLRLLAITATNFIANSSCFLCRNKLFEAFHNHKLLWITAKSKLKKQRGIIYGDLQDSFKHVSIKYKSKFIWLSQDWANILKFSCDYQWVRGKTWQINFITATRFC